MRLDDSVMQDAKRLLTICSVCDYCSGFCETFRAAGRRTSFLDGDITYLAHLCHDCGNCVEACQYAPPHIFDIDPPKALAQMRAQFWPQTRSWIALAFVPLTPLLTLLSIPADILFRRHIGPGAFYVVLPWSVLCVTAGLVVSWSLGRLCRDIIRFWKESGGGDPRGAIRTALSDMITLRNLQGGGIACGHGSLRRWAHGALVTGFSLCFVSTFVATIYHHCFDYQAPYPLISLPVGFGSVGGLMMIVGCGSLWWSKLARNRKRRVPLLGDTLLLTLLVLVSVTGFGLLIWRETMMMGMLLALHFGTVLSLFLFLSSGKLAHGAYRAAALLRAAMERRQF